MFDKVMDWLTKFEHSIQVIVMENNNSVIVDGIFTQQVFLSGLLQYDFELINLSENTILLKANGNSYAIQVSNLEYQKEFKL